MRPPSPRLSPSVAWLCVLLGCAGSMQGSVDKPAPVTGHDAGPASAQDAGRPPDDRDSGRAVSPDEPDASHASPAGPIDAEAVGPYAVGTLRFEISATGGRTLPVQLWYPAAESAREAAKLGRAIEDFEPAGERHDLLASLVALAPDGCTNKTMHAADAPAALSREQAWPAVVFSHCSDCTRFAAFSSAEHLASWGFVVAAPDHEGGTLYDAQRGTSVGVTPEFLATRAKDISSVIDVLLDRKATVMPADLRGTIDSNELGVFGHGVGSVTTGLVLQDDLRVKAGVMIAAPPEDAALGKVSLSEIHQPSLFLLAREDHEISEAGNLVLRNNYDSYPNEAWLVEVVDAGHWSFSDICALTARFKAGCGDDTRDSSLVESVAFTYLDNDIARGIAQAYTLAYFGKELTDDSVAGEYLKSPRPTQYVAISHHK